MSTQWQPKPTLPEEEPPTSVDLALYQLGQDLVAPGPVQRVGLSDPQTYCSNCWAHMPEGATECADCGETVAAMQAVERERAAKDAAWVPPGRRSELETESPLEWAEPAPVVEPRYPEYEPYSEPYAAPDLELPLELEPVVLEAPVKKGHKQKALRERPPKFIRQRRAPVDTSQFAPFGIALLIGSAVGVMGGSAAWLMLLILRTTH